MSRSSSWQDKIRPGLRCAIILRGRRCCAWCKRRLTKATTTLDHVVPRRDGGSNRADNFVPACGGCNIERNFEGHLEQRLAERNITMADAWAEVRAQIAAPIDRAAGNRLAERWYPWCVEMRQKNADRMRLRREANKVAAATMGGVEFPFGAAS